MGKKLFNIGLVSDILELSPKAQATKAKVYRWDSSKLKSSAQQRKLLTK